MAPSKEEKKFILEVIEMYHGFPELWKVKSKEFSDREKKEAAYDTLLLKYKEWYTEATKDDLKKKLNAMRTSFRRLALLVHPLRTHSCHELMFDKQV
ncbi:hypothetical protein PoB_003248800 [Plakobranchus ocellatus]|uniref:MADF domain-containing protein n=1 Tax=Plakobranchus ocellatus TaxID=259542 RepID=A0AAV4AHH2_9GAST|nr:hypothetical protein PoB_003248800 [Plakobranchus ocellatus]